MTKMTKIVPRSVIIFLLCGLFAPAIHSQVLTIDKHSFLLDQKPFDMWGVRIASASQDKEYTQSVIANLDDYKSMGINTVSIFVQGSSGGFSDPFKQGGLQIEKAHFNRLKKLIKSCAKRDMVVIVGIFYQRTIKDPKISNLKSEGDIRNAVSTITSKLKPYRNVIINIANEQNSAHYDAFSQFSFNDPDNIISLCLLVKDVDPKRLVGGGGYDDELNVVIGRSEYVDVLLFDTFSGDIEQGHHSGWHYDYFVKQGVVDKPIVNVEIFGGWTRKFVPQGVYTQEGKSTHLVEIAEAKKRPGLYVHLHSNPWFQGVAQDFGNRFDLGGNGTTDSPGVRWYFNEIIK